MGADYQTNHGANSLVKRRRVEKWLFLSVFCYIPTNAERTFVRVYGAPSGVFGGNKSSNSRAASPLVRLRRMQSNASVVAHFISMRIAHLMARHSGNSNLARRQNDKAASSFTKSRYLSLILSCHIFTLRKPCKIVRYRIWDWNSCRHPRPLRQPCALPPYPWCSQCVGRIRRSAFDSWCSSLYAICMRKVFSLDFGLDVFFVAPYIIKNTLFLIVDN